MAAQQKNTNTEITQSALGGDSTSFKVTYIAADKTPKSIPAMFINGNFEGSFESTSFNPSIIDRVEVKKSDFKINNTVYPGQIFLYTKNNYQPRFIFLEQIVSKFLPAENKYPTVIQIDESIITTPFNQYKIDEGYILKIIIDTLSNTANHFNLLKIITKSEQHIQQEKKKQNEIWIRGNNDMALKEKLR